MVGVAVFQAIVIARVIEIRRERGGGRVPFTEQELTLMRRGLSAEEYRRGLIHKYFPAHDVDQGLVDCSGCRTGWAEGIPPARDVAGNAVDGSPDAISFGPARQFSPQTIHPSRSCKNGLRMVSPSGRSGVQPQT
jgi:hypothetical protein